jgi:hypothetical protein
MRLVLEMTSVKVSWRTAKLRVHTFEEPVVGSSLEVSIKKYFKKRNERLKPKHKVFSKPRIRHQWYTEAGYRLNTFILV